MYCMNITLYMYTERDNFKTELYTYNIITL